MPDPTPESLPTRPTAARPTKRRVPILIRHAISLLVVFVLALPVSYLGIRYYVQQQKIAQLDAADQQTFDKGLAYVYAKAATDEAVAEAAFERVATLPDEQAVELYRVLLRAFTDTETALPDPTLSAGIALMDRVDMTQAVQTYRRLVMAGYEDDPQLNSALNRQLNIEDDLRFIQLVEFYDSKAMWSKDAVPAEAWLRWSLLLSQSKAELTQRLTARRLGEMPEQVNNSKVAEALTRLSQSEHASVRAQVLKSVAGYAAIADDPTAYEQIIFTLGQDENQTLARRAWQVVGHLNPLSGFSPNWQDAPPFVAEAILWAAVKTNPDQIGPAIAAARKPNINKEAILALSQKNPFLLNTFNTQYNFDACRNDFDETFDPLLTWREILTFDPHSGDSEYWYVYLTSLLDIRPYDDPFSDSKPTEETYSQYLAYAPAIKWAVTYRINEYYGTDQFDGDDEAADEQRRNDSLGELAAVEGMILEPYTRHARQPSQFPYVELIGLTGGLKGIDVNGVVDVLDFQDESIRTLLAAALSHVDTKIIEQILRRHNPLVGQAAAIGAAVGDKRPKLIRGINAATISNNPDITDEKLFAMSDEELAELGLRRVDAITALLDVAEKHPDRASQYETIRLLKLALWMRGDLGDEFTPRAEAMLLDPRLPTSTVLLALLHKQRPIALEYLFGDLVEPNPDLRKLLISERFWHVLRRFVKTDDLDLWLWGDPAAQDFQIEAMRQWYWVNRFKIEDLWIAD